MKQRTIKTILVSLLAASVLLGQSVNDDISRSRQNAITRTVDAVSAAVVGINVIEVREYRDPFANFFGTDPFFNQFFGNRNYKQEV
jgi:hypothetical protein